MEISEKAKRKLDGASKEIKVALDGLAGEVAALSERVRQKLKGGGEEVKEAAESLTRQVKELSEKVKQLIPKPRLKHRIPVRREREPAKDPERAEFSLQVFHREFNRLWDDFFRRFEFSPEHPIAVGSGRRAGGCEIQKRRAAAYAAQKCRRP